MKKIFFVHDLQDSPAARHSLLEMAGYEVVMMASSQDLMVSLKDEQPDLVLLDVLIEGKNGFETAREITTRYPKRRFPIVLASRIYRARQFREEALRCGAHDYLLLPARPEVFLERVTLAIQAFLPPEAKDASDPAAA